MSYSQAGQDMYVLEKTGGKRNGTYLEIGGNHYKNISNSYKLETEYGWRGVIVERDYRFYDGYKQFRPLAVPVIADARCIDYVDVLRKHAFPAQMDFLQIDLEVRDRSTLDVLELLDRTVFPHYTFATVTFEHDIYTGNHHDTRARSRAIFAARGYTLDRADVRGSPDNKSGPIFEDWYLGPGAS